MFLLARRCRRLCLFFFYWCIKFVYVCLWWVSECVCVCRLFFYNSTLVRAIVQIQTKKWTLDTRTSRSLLTNILIAKSKNFEVNALLLLFFLLLLSPPFFSLIYSFVFIFLDANTPTRDKQFNRMRAKQKQKQ